MELFEGQIISAPFLKEKGKVKKFEIKHGYYLLELIYLKNNQFESLQISEDQLSQVNVEERDLFGERQNSEDFFFWIEANRLRLAYEHDPLLAVNISQIDPLPHQIEAVYDYVLRDPKIRFLIADDAGAGKTIMAGLAIKELQYRNMAERILIVAPSHLKYQWQREMKEKFNTNFRLLTRSTLDETWGVNVWEELNRIIASIDFLKQDDILPKLQTAEWDLVIVDEAHKMSAYGYPTKKGYQITKTKRYQVGEVLSKISTHILFLTATPHKGDEENFKLFLDLLRPGFFARTDFLKESIENKENPIFVRRLKEDMRTFEGNKIFPPRHVNTISFRLTKDERELYERVTRYVRYYYDKSRQRRSITFAMLVLQRRLTSSINSILQSLKNRRKRLLELIKLISKKKYPIRESKFDSLTDEDIEDIEDMEESERWKLEEKILGLTLTTSVKDIQEEINRIEDLIYLAMKVKEAEIESKLTKLRDEILTTLGDKKLLIFTEYRDTLTYLVEKLSSWGYNVVTIDGYMKIEERIQAEKDFWHEKQIMVATEAAGEGINLQCCSWMVNYDIPWNPTRLEQRMGRIHRYGQDKEVFVYNMVTRDTREGQVLDRLFEKLQLMKESLGDRVFDIIGDLIPGSNLKEVLEEAVFGQKRIDEIYEFVDSIDDEKSQKIIDKITLTSLATHHIDYTSLKRKSRVSDEHRLIPEYIEDYFQRAIIRLDGRIEKVKDYITVKNVPKPLLKLNKDPRFYSKYGKILRKYNRLIFDKKKALKFADYVYIAPGHELLEALNETVVNSFWSPENVALFADETNTKEGIFWFIIGEIKDGFGNIAGRRLYCLYQDMQKNIQILSSSILWDLKPVKNIEIDETLRGLINNQEEILDYATVDLFFPYREEISKKRRIMCNIKEKYGLRSIDYLLQESNNKILQYQLQQEEQKDMRLPLTMEERRKEDLEIKRENIVEEIELEQNLTVSSPEIIGCAIVVPLERIDNTMKYEKPDIFSSSDEIEQKGMEVAIKYEKEEGWKVDDVHLENLGFDLRSLKFNVDGTYQEIRYIEVKARAKEGAIRLTANEWKKAKRFQDKYWLYIVTFAATEEPNLERIQNPTKKFILDEDIYATGYIIPKDKWKLSN